MSPALPLNQRSPLEQLEVSIWRGSLYEFLKVAWPTLEPATPLVDNWHLEAICEHLQSVVLREPGSATPKNLVVNVPPGTMKSLITSVALPAWVWLKRPAWRAIFASANPRVALRDSMRCRDLIESEWYRETFEVKWQLAEDQNAKGAYKNTAGGSRLAVSVGAKITGDRADALFIDDPHDAAEIHSKLIRESALLWYDSAFANRVNSPIDSTIVLIMQRLHENDLAAHVLAQGNFAHLSIPMEFEKPRAGMDSRQKTWLGWVDPRVHEGALLMPARFPREVLDAELKRMGSTVYAGQMQQRPVPATGNKFKREWWRFWSPTALGKPRPLGCTETPPRVMNPSVFKFDEIIGSVDAAFKEGTDTDFVVGLVIGRKGADKFVLARYRGRWGIGKTLEMVRQMKRDWPNLWRILIEDKANGSAVIETLKGEITGIVEVQPEGGKESRAAVLEPEVESGNWFLPDGAEWLDEWCSEFAAFPLGSNDDQVDAASQAAIKLRLTGDAAYSSMLLGIARR